MTTVIQTLILVALAIGTTVGVAVKYWLNRDRKKHGHEVLTYYTRSDTEEFCQFAKEVGIYLNPEIPSDGFRVSFDLSKKAPAYDWGQFIGLLYQHFFRNEVNDKVKETAAKAIIRAVQNQFGSKDQARFWKGVEDRGIIGGITNPILLDLKEKILLDIENQEIQDERERQIRRSRKIAGL